MASTHTRSHNTVQAHTVAGSDPTRQRSHRVYASTTVTNESGVDFMAVERVVNGDLPLPQLNEAEQELAARLMSREGHPAYAIADRVGVETRTVTRWRADWRRQGG